MKASELRIGNYVDGEGKTIIIESINWDGINGGLYRYDEYSIDALKPIQLTEQWLLDFGFDKSNDEEGVYIISCFSMDTEVCMFCLFHEGYGFSYRIGLSKCEHVHQLQNLYFALTGEELTIKEKVK